MTSPSALVDTVALMLFQNLREGMETGRIADINTAQTEVENAIAKLSRQRTLGESTHLSDLVGKLFLEVGSLHEKVAKCESQLDEVQSQAKAIKKDTSQITARAETCNLLAEQQQKEDTKVLAAVDGVRGVVSTVPPSSIALVSPPTDFSLRSPPSRAAIISFPGGPRTVTIHPPDSPSYQSTIRDEKGDVIIDFRRTKPLRREGAFRGPLEDVDWVKLTRVWGRGPDPPGDQAVPPVPGWSDRSQSSSCPAPSRGPSNVVAKQRQSSASTPTDAFGQVITLDYSNSAKSSSLPTGTSSSQASSQAPQSSLSSKPDILSTPSSTPRSRPVGRGRKRVRDSEGDMGVPPTIETYEEGAAPTDPPTVEVPTTPTPVGREASRPPEGPVKRTRLLSSTSRSLSRTRSVLDLARAA